MTNVGDPGHIAAHNVLREHVLAEAARFGLTPPTLAGPFTGGEPDHIGAHNALVSAIQDVATAGGITVTLPDLAKLGDSGHVADHDAMRAALAVIQAAPAWNSATGGTVTDVTNYNGTGELWRVHSFSTGSASLVVTRSVQNWSYLAAAGGGSVTDGTHGGGGGAGGLNLGTYASSSFATGTYPIVVGGVGANTTFNGLTLTRGGNGGREIITGQGAGASGGSGGGAGGAGGSGGGFTSGGAGTAGQGNAGGNYNNGGNINGSGGGGAGGPGVSGNSGGAGGLGVTSNIDGTSRIYCSGQPGQKSGLSVLSYRGGGSQAGIVIVAYRIG